MRKSIQRALDREGMRNKTKFILTNVDAFVQAQMESWTDKTDYRAMNNMIRDHVEEAISDGILNAHFDAEGRVELTWTAESKQMEHQCKNLLTVNQEKQEALERARAEKATEEKK